MSAGAWWTGRSVCPVRHSRAAQRLPHGGAADADALGELLERHALRAELRQLSVGEREAVPAAG